MDRIVYYAALLINVVQLGFSVFLFVESYGRSDSLLAVLLILPPIISLMAIHFSPDFEERRLTRKLRKARLRRDLKELGQE
ncbi:MAG: hypothetical protein WBK77_01615 [Alphaproteobacteria bacterium]